MNKNPSTRKEAKKKSSATSRKAWQPAGTDAPAACLENLGELPRSYGADIIFLIAQEPRRLFTCWDIDISLHPGGKTFLRIYEGGETRWSEIEVPFETRNWHIPVGTAGENYTVEIGYYRGSTWNVLARSVTVRTPQDKMSDSDRFDCATIPLHMSFQQLAENFNRPAGEAFASALERLQQDGRLLSFCRGETTLDPDERILLEALLGRNLLEELSSHAGGSDELSSRINAYLQERLHSADHGEFLSSSWLEAAKSSWLGAETSSWAAIWSQFATSSWSNESSGGSENLGSFGFSQREFFMHVNAEVIFYGGTHPQAEVTIDGKPVKLNPDGTFRHHFIFPDGTYEIPIAATSPDGKETRSATLTLGRSTARVGGVAHTGQPDLGVPMGSRS